MGGRFVISLDLDRGDGQNRKELERIFYTGKVLVYSKDPERIKDFIRQNFEFCMIYVQASDLNVQDVVSLLDIGATEAFITVTHAKEIIQKRLLPEHLQRLTITLGDVSSKQAQDELSLIFEAFPGIGVHADKAERDVLEFFYHPIKKYVSYPSDSSTTLESVQNDIKDGYTAIVPTSLIKKEKVADSPNISLESLTLSSLVSDREDGLLPTLVVNERGISLGLVYSNSESVKASLETGRGVYWSRKRGLWPKGESSGDIQELVRIDVDCDGDALQFVVRQKGDGG